MKICVNCSQSKEVNEYYVHKNKKDGLMGKCKDCVKKQVRSNKTNYDLTEKGVIRVIYKTQKRNNENRGFGELPYSKEGLSAWLYCNGFKHLYDEWVESSHKKDKKPSVDRVDDLKGYSLGNIRLVTWHGNRSKQYEDIVNGVGTSGKRCKPLYKYSNEIEFISLYKSYSSAVRDVGHSLEYPIKSKTKCKSGFYWSYVPF